MSDATTVDYGDFPPAKTITEGGVEFYREVGTRAEPRGRIAVWDFRVSDVDPIGFLEPSVTTIAAALVWLAGFRQGHRLGVTAGREEVQRDIRRALGITG
jgi:hypothetical protein